MPSERVYDPPECDLKCIGTKKRYPDDTIGCGKIYLSLTVQKVDADDGEIGSVDVAQATYYPSSETPALESIRADRNT